jgi:outer membrane protein TolC
MMRRGSILAALVLTASLGLAQAPSDAGPWTLEAAIATARARNPAARAAESDALTARLNVRKAFAQGYLPRLELSVFSGLVPEARGDIFTSPDEQTDLDGLGIFSRLNLDVTQPLMTFGRAGAAVTAAREAAGAEESRRDQFLEDLSLEVAKAFWGLVSALRAEDLARESGESYEELLAEIEKRLAREDSEVDDENLFEARSHQLEIEVVKEDSIERKAQAARLLCLLLDLDPATPVSVTGAPPPVFSADEDLMRKMTDRAEGSRPDILALASAERALGAKILLRKREGWPVLFLAANFGYARAPNRQDQTNPFVVDNFNYRNLGLALGLSWKPDLFVDPVEVRQAESERRAVEDRLAALRSLSAFEVSRAFGDARKNGALLEAARRSLAAAKAWVRLSRENWDMGLGDAYRLLRAYQSYFELRGAEIERENVLNVSLARLAHVVGDVGLYVDWVERGKVVFD